MKDIITLEYALRLAGLAHFGILAASALTPRVLRWNEVLGPLPEMLRRLFWVYGIFIVLMIIGLGTFTCIHADDIARGDAVARSVAIFAAVFWGLRLAVQAFVFDARSYLTNAWLKAGYHGLTVTFIYFVAVFIWAAVRR